MPTDHRKRSALPPYRKISMKRKPSSKNHRWNKDLRVLPWDLPEKGATTGHLDRRLRPRDDYCGSRNRGDLRPGCYWSTTSNHWQLMPLKPHLQSPQSPRAATPKNKDLTRRRRSFVNGSETPPANYYIPAE